MKLEKIEHDFSVCKVCDYTQINLNWDYCFIGKTDEENSLVCMTEHAPDNVLEYDDGWRAFRIEGVLEFSLIGILSRISAILAENQIGLFAISTYNTDYIFVKKENVQKAAALLSKAGYIVA